ncbi:Spy/CpxP family protein refolding chaperone [Thiobacillus sp.]|uniref:Spy/CpxP family protein refolding chaperone n=2 Tax=Thiobacillus sp. TaxID=924 RepID=UPI0025E694F5|nr:Spy/CpxP family protein refolding chaperone [Thiobacillus sp.]MBT9538840.1 Spy/CpxP family protein refolding chaperone [Thiobacillus sp.]
MKSMKTQRALLVALLVGSGVLAASAYAMNGGPDGKPGCEMRHGPAMQEKMVERHDKRLAELKDKLKLTPAQTAAWQTFAEAEKPRQPAQDREAMREAYAKMNTPQRLDAMLEKSNVRHAKMVARVEAVKSFYAQLTPEQQAVFDAQARPNLGHGHHGKARQQS